MPSQVEFLEQLIERQAKKHGADAPIVKDLKQQLASLQSASKPPRENPVTFQAGMQGSSTNQNEPAPAADSTPSE